jgi:hypothetical protein
VVIWEVVRVSDGTLVCQCGCERDAIALAAMVPGRAYRMMRRLPPEIIDVFAIVDGELPGNLGLPGRGAQLEEGPAILLTQGEGVPMDLA